MIAMVNKILNRTEITIFLIFLLLYSIFIQWNGWDENSRFFLTQAIVDEGRLEIDSFANQTSDRAVVQNHYYSDKDPGASFFATIPYSIFKLVFHDAVSTDTVAMYLTNHVGNSKIYDILNPDWFTLYSMIAVVIFTSVLFSALTLVLIYKITGLFTDERNKRLLVTISAGLATTIFPYALVFTDNAIAGFFSLLGFYLLLKKKFQNLEAKKQKNYSFFSGIAFGLSILASIFGVIISGIAFLYLLKMKNKNRYLKLFIIGFSLILLVYLSYNFLIFKNPLAWRYNYLDTNVFIYSKRDPSALWRFFVPNIYIVWRLLIDPYKGLFFYYPILLLSLYGLYKMSKLRMGAEVALISLIFVFNVILNSSSATGAWWGGGGFFGPRHLTYSVPFLTVALVFSFNSSSYRSVSYLLFIVLVVYSTVVNFAGIRVPFPEITAADKLTLDPQYVARVNSFEVLVNPIFDYYLPEFFKTGPVSRILETSFSCDNKIDIRQPLPIHQQNCTKPMIAEIETPIAANQSIKLCVCSQYGGGDGTIVNFEIDNTKNYIHIDSNKCKTEILEVPFTTNVTHKIKIEPVNMASGIQLQLWDMIVYAQ